MRTSDLFDKSGVIPSVLDPDESMEPDFVIHELLLPKQSEIAEDENTDVPLPSQIKCSPHSLNLIGKTDSFFALLDEHYNEVYTRVFTKLNVIWAALTSSRKNSELVEECIGQKLLKPHRIRWNRIYDAVSDIYCKI